MEKPACLFGPFFRKERQSRGISLWQIVHRLEYYLSNLQRIEKGERQPGINLSLKMLDVIGASPGEFMGRLAAENFQYLPASVSPLTNVMVSYQKPIHKTGMKSLFGPLLLQARVAGAVSQTAMARASGYHLRNINCVEKGKQEPGIMTALALVMTTGVNVREFFDCLYAFWKEET